MVPSPPPQEKNMLCWPTLLFLKRISQAKFDLVLYVFL